MNSDDLRAEKTQMEQSLANWKAELSQAQERAALSQRQIDVHTGHIERINMWLAKLEQQADPKEETSPAPDPVALPPEEQ
ncbi:MAG: hypothetical protein DCC55_15090 [Chloroflexi bacterium]|nr:MAG: hypothetical protein DCC55_15090 [Chloroflexota bacterium]